MMMYMVVTINPIDLSYIGHWDCEVGPSEESWSHCLLSSKQKHFYFRWASCRYSCACGLEALSRSSIFKTSTSFPATTTHTTSTKRFTCSMLCETMITVKPRVFFSWSTVSSMWWVEIGSSALVGSSRRRTCWSAWRSASTKVWKNFLAGMKRPYSSAKQLNNTKE